MFESGVIDELLYLDLPHEHIQLSGSMTLEYGKAVQVSIYEQFRIVREGKLRIIFAPDLKIQSWEFCAWHHEELLPRNLVAPQIGKLVHTVQRYQSFIDCSGSVGVSPHDLQANCNVFLVAGCQLVRNLELQLVDNLGFSKRYVRCLQISEIINLMKDLMTLSLNKNIGPIESLKCYSQENGSTNLLKDEQRRKESDRFPSVGWRKYMSNNENDDSNITSCEEASVSAGGYYTPLLGQSSKTSKVRTELGASLGSLRGSNSLNAGHTKNLSHASECQQKTDNNLIQKLLQEMIINSRTPNRGREKCSSSTLTDSPAAARGTATDEYKVAFNDSMASQAVGKFSSFTAATDVDPCGICGNGKFSRREQHLSEAVHNMISGFNLKRA